jgi:hypothetical protein
MQVSGRCPSYLFVPSEDPDVDSPFRYGDRFVEGTSCLRVFTIGEPLVAWIVRANFFENSEICPLEQSLVHGIET